jgi:hypothetical protein
MSLTSAASASSGLLTGGLQLRDWLICQGVTPIRKDGEDQDTPPSFWCRSLA